MASSLEATSFLSAYNADFIAGLYAKWLRNPESIEGSWRSFFEELGLDASSVLEEMKGASWATHDSAAYSIETEASHDKGEERVEWPQARPSLLNKDYVRQTALDSIRALMLIRAYRIRGHLNANLDPLGLEKKQVHPELEPATYGFSPGDWDRPIFINYYLGLESATLREIVTACRETYCGSIGIEYMHVQEPSEKAWLQERIEGIRNRTEFTDLGKRTILKRLIQADIFETFLDKKFTGTKRFGLDGGDSLVPLIEQLFKRGAQLGVEEVVLGMAHRGRLNVLGNIMRKPYRAIFSEFRGVSANPDDVQGSGDVKYHLGTSADREFDGKTVHLSLTANPSHLEAVNTVVLGKVRAKQKQRGDTARDQVVGLLLHGDAAFIGQGIVAETFLTSQLRGYRTGGAIHVVINNQIGFTTSPAHSRSSPYCSDMAKMIDAPVFHVNGDDPEACVHTARIAIEYRQKFKKDVVIDMWCYRRHGHNETDEPSFTQPLMYKKIAQQPRVREIYAKKLEDEGTLEPGTGKAITQEFQKYLEEEFEASNSYKPNKADWLEGQWAGLGLAEGDERRGETSVDMDLLREIGHAISQVPQNFNANSKIVRQLQAKRKMIQTGEGIDWSTAEALSFGTLLCESTAVRLSGEDSQRGTFSQRHAVLIDQETETNYIPLNHIRFGQAPFEVIDSPLSEFGVLGYEYGYALAEPHALVLWEAQFGDFANGAQVIIDQFIASGESKWLRMCGLVMLLPHGYEGQGPEHSSARLERYLQLCAEDNLQICNITTPANYFHVLRRQIRRNFRKPLIQMTPKSLLRHKRCVSRLIDFGPGTSFHRVLPDDAAGTAALAKDEAIRRVILCSGKVYYDLLEERENRKISDIYLLRVEQLYPFPRKSLMRELARFPNAEIVWCQEEPQNTGAWFFIDRRIESVLEELDHKSRRPKYIGRPEAASPATGNYKRHIAEQNALFDAALAAPNLRTVAKPVIVTPSLAKKRKV
ncbi:MAG: 2-oxoglutarate dehydrogenase E1 component [Alphaproteobacteria bacterium]